MVKIMLAIDTAFSVCRMEGRTQVSFLKRNHVSSLALFRFVSLHELSLESACARFHIIALKHTTIHWSTARTAKSILPITSSVNRPIADSHVAFTKCTIHICGRSIHYPMGHVGWL